MRTEKEMSERLADIKGQLSKVGLNADEVQRLRGWEEALRWALTQVVNAQGIASQEGFGNF